MKTQNDSKEKEALEVKVPDYAKDIELVRYVEGEYGDRKRIKDGQLGEYCKDYVDRVKSDILNLQMNCFAFDPKEFAVIGKVDSAQLPDVINIIKNLAKVIFESEKSRFTCSKTEKTLVYLEDLVKDLGPFAKIISNEMWIPHHFANVEVDNGNEYAGVLLKFYGGHSGQTLKDFEQKYLAFLDSLPKDEFKCKEGTVQHLEKRIALRKFGYDEHFFRDEERQNQITEFARKLNAKEVPAELVKFYILNMFKKDELKDLNAETLADYVGNDAECAIAIEEAVKDLKKEIAANIASADNYYLHNLIAIKDTQKQKEHQDYVNGLYGKLKAFESWQERFDKCRKTANINTFFQREAGD